MSINSVLHLRWFRRLNDPMFAPKAHAVWSLTCAPMLNKPTAGPLRFRSMRPANSNFFFDVNLLNSLRCFYSGPSRWRLPLTTVNAIRTQINSTTRGGIDVESAFFASSKCSVLEPGERQMKDLQKRGKTYLRRVGFARQFCDCANMPIVLMGFFDSKKRSFSECWIGQDNPMSNENGHDAITAAEKRLAAWASLKHVCLDNEAAQNSSDSTETSLTWMEIDDYAISVGTPTNDVYPVLGFPREAGANLASRKALFRMGMAYVTHQLTEEIYARSVWMETLVETAMQVLSIHFLVVTAEGEVKFDSLKNQAHKLSKNDKIVCNRILSVTQKSKNPELREAIQAAISDQQRTSIVSVFTSPGVARLIVVTPLEISGSALALILFESENTNHFELRERFLSAYKLTKSERLIAHEILKGRSLTQAAVETDLSIATVRSYMKQVFAKTGTHRQSELVSLYFGSILPVTCDLQPCEEKRLN